MAEGTVHSSGAIETFTASDGYCWRYRHYRPTGHPRARVVCIHGIQTHGGWYTRSCARLSQAGFDVSFVDRRGSGLNEQERGDAPSFRRLLDDLAEFLGPVRRKQTRSSQPTAHCPLPTFLIAISWGGKLAVALQRRHPGLVAGLALVCPGFFSRVRPSLKHRLAIAWSRLVAPRRRFPIPLNDPGLFTATPRWQQFIRDDPLSLRQGTARLLLESVRLDSYIRFVPKYVTAPVLLLLAERDRIIDNAATRRYVESFASSDKQIIEYAGAHHTLEFEPEPDRYSDDLVAWINQHLSGAADERG